MSMGVDLRLVVAAVAMGLGCGIRAGAAVKLLASDGGADAQFGRAVAAAGDVVVIDAAADDDAGSASGSVHVFERNAGGGGTSGQVAKLTALDAAAGDHFGVAVAADASGILVGADDNDDAGSSSGSAHLFGRSAAGAWVQTAKLTASDAAAGDRFGRSVAVAGDVVVAGSYGDDSATSGRCICSNGIDSEAAYIFEEFFAPPQPVITGLSHAGAQPELTRISVAPADYTVQFRAGLEDGLPWQEVPGAVDLPGEDGSMSAKVPSTGGRVYRIKAANSPLR